jgi:HK97 family phage prohead protease
MSKRREIRTTSLRAAEFDGRPGVSLKVITPYVVDDYGSVFMPGTFDESLGRRAPVLCWAHEWEDPLGPYLAHRADTDGAPIVDFAFSDFEAVPQSRRAHAQVGDGTIVDCSVGFSNTERRSPTEDEVKLWPGVREVITRADLDEVSLVLRGAVPGAKVLSMRSGGQVNIDAVVEIAKRKAAGELTDAEAQAALELLAGGDEAAPQDEPTTDPVDEPVVEVPDMTAEIDAALAVIGRSAKR